MESLCEQLQRVRNHLKTIEVISGQSLMNLQFYIKSLTEEIARLDRNAKRFNKKSKRSFINLNLKTTKVAE